MLAGIEEGDERCRLALDVYGHRLRAGIASMAAALGGLDAVVFTGGVGENAAEGSGRGARRAARGSWASRSTRERNATAEPDAVLSAPGPGPAVVVVAAREDLEIAREVRRVLS